METPEQLLATAMAAKQDRRLDDAKAAMQEAVQLLREQSRRVELAHALRELGEVEKALGELDRAAASYAEAVAILRSEGQHRKLAHTLRHLASIKKSQGKPGEAVACCEEMLGIYATHGPDSELEQANAFRSAALAYEATGDRDAAARHWRDAESAYAKTGVHAGIEESRAHLDQLRG